MWNQQNCWTLQTRAPSGINRLCDQKEALYCWHKRNGVPVRNLTIIFSRHNSKNKSSLWSKNICLPGLCGLFFFQLIVYLRNIFRIFSSISGIVCITIFFLWKLYESDYIFILSQLPCSDCICVFNYSIFFSWRSYPRALRVQPQMLKLDLRTLYVLSLLLKWVWAGVLGDVYGGDGDQLGIIVIGWK